MTDTTDAFLAHYGVKGMKWGETRSREEIDAALGNLNSGGDLDDLDLETLGSHIDASLSGKKKPPSVADRLLGRDKDDGFWESAGRNVENLLGALFGKNAQAERNKKVANMPVKAAAAVGDFLSDIFKKK